MSTSYGTIPYSGVPEESNAFGHYDPVSDLINFKFTSVF